MRAYSDVYLGDVVENQGKLFDYVADRYLLHNQIIFLDSLLHHLNRHLNMLSSFSPLTTGY